MSRIKELQIQVHKVLEKIEDNDKRAKAVAFIVAVLQDQSVKETYIGTLKDGICGLEYNRAKYYNKNAKIHKLRIKEEFLL